MKGSRKNGKVPLAGERGQKKESQKTSTRRVHDQPTSIRERETLQGKRWAVHIGGSRLTPPVRPKTKKKGWVSKGRLKGGVRSLRKSSKSSKRGRRDRSLAGGGGVL